MAGPWRDVCGVRIAPAELRFCGTLPGNHYRASLTVQNLRAGTCRLQLLPPNRPQFKLIVENPKKPIASGLQVNAVVEYSPDCAADLRDKLVLLVDEEIVDIPLLGLIPQCQLEIESEVNFGEMIANNKIVTKKIRITNHGSVPGLFRIPYDGVVLLDIKPKRGVVKPKSVRTIEVSICTDAPGVIKEMMKVELDGCGCNEVWVKGVVVQQALKVLGVACGKVLKCVNFGPLYFGTSKTEQINLYNESPDSMDWIAVLEDNAVGGEMGTDLQGSTDAVLQDLSVKNSNVDASTFILCVPNQGTLQPFEKTLITLSFSPEKFERHYEMSDSLQIQDYVIFLRFETVGKRGECLQTLSDSATATTRSNYCHVDLALMASGFPVVISFKPGPVINFKDCYLGEKSQVVCTIKNESEFLPVTFRFRKAAHFNISPERGKLERKAEKEVMISFYPRQFGTFEMKQIVDIIGPAIDKNNVNVLKKKSFHQIYLTFLGVCKSKRKSILFSINPGLTPLISNETGQFVVDDTGHFSDTAPVAILKSTQTQIHTHRKNRNCKDDALIAFPNDRAASLRPSEWNKKYRTIFTKTERYNYIDPEFAYTDSERLLRQEHKKHYIDFISRLRQRRLDKEGAREYSTYNNPVSIGIKPADGLTSPHISIKDISEEKPQHKMLALEGNDLLTSQKLEAIVSKTTNKEVWSWLSPMPSSTQEKEDCGLTLTHRQLHQIFIGPSTIDFGEVCVHSTTTKELHIINNLSVHILVQIEIKVMELQETSPLSQVVPPLTKTHIPVVFETNAVGMFKRSFSYKINNQHIGHVLVIAHALPIELELSKRELILNPIPGYLAGTEFRRAVRICNRRNYPAGFTWKPLTAHRKTAFTIKPTRGIVEAYSELECEVVWHPGFSASETGEFVLCVRKGKSIKLKCIAKLGVPKVQVTTPSVSFTQCPIGMTVCKTATIHNTGSNHAYFQVRDSNLLPGMKIIPYEGAIPVGGCADLKISFTPNAHISFDKSVEVAVRNAQELVFKIDGFAGFADINIDVDLFDYEGVYVGSTKSIPFLIENRGESHTRVNFDFSLNSDFKLNTTDNSVIESSPLKPDLYSVYLKERSSLNCFLTLMPKQVALYDFILPIGVPGLSPPMADPPESPRSSIVSQPNPLTKALPRCRVKAVALHSLLKLSSMELKFEQHSSNIHSNTAERSMNSQEFVLKNVSGGDLRWKLNFDDADKNIEDGIFRFSQKTGHLLKDQEVSIAVSFCPPSSGKYTSKITISLKSNPSEYQVTLSGSMKSPKMKFHPPFLMLMPVPLDVETKEDFTIIPQDYIRKTQFRVKLPELVLGDGTKTSPLTAEFPEGQDIDVLSDGTVVERICRVTFRSSKPMSHLAEILFIDEEENRFVFQVAVTADNCLLTLYPYLALHYPQEKIIWRSNNKDFSTGEVVLQPSVMSQASSNSISSSSFGEATVTTYDYSLSESTTFESESDEFTSEESEEISEESEYDSQIDEDGNKRELSYFPDEDKAEYVFFQKTLTAVRTWFTHFGWPRGQNPISIPYSLRRDVCIVQLTVPQEKIFKRKLDRDKGFYEMILHLNGQPIPGISASQSLPLDPVERMFQLHWQHSELLSFLKRKGASLSHVMPEFLLEPEDYKIWAEVHTGMRCFTSEGRRGSMRSSGKLSAGHFFVLKDRAFETMSKRAWTDVLLQIYKVFVLPRVSFRIASNPSSSESLPNMPRIKSDPLSSNIYSRYERTILIWLNKNYEKNRKIVWKDSRKGGIPPTRWIVNFDQDLLDGLVLAAQVAAYCPYLVSTHFIRMYTGPKTHEQFLHNCLILVKALRAVNLNMGIKATDICDPNPIKMLIFCVHLYDNLPQYLPMNTIEFAGPLHTTVSKQVRLKNPRNSSLTYNAVLLGRDASGFSLPKGHSVTIPPTKYGFVNVEFTFRFLHPAEAVLILVSSKVDGFDSATLTFSLKAEVRHIEPFGVIRCKSPCYELKKFNPNITNPFRTDGIFRVILLESTQYFLQPEKVYQGSQVKKEEKFSSENNTLNSKISALTEDSKKETSPDQSGLLHEYFSPIETLFLKGKGSATLEVHFLPFRQERRYCTVLLSNEQIGEFIYLIEGIGDSPLPSVLPALDSPNVLRATNTSEDPSASRVLYLKCGLGQTLKENLRIPLINEARERALALAAQQQMSALEYERRLITGTLQSSSVRVATALLGLSRVERRALLKPRTHPPEQKYVDYHVEVSMNEFEVPKKFSIPVLASTRVKLDASSAKHPTSQKIGDSDTVDLPIKFTPRHAGCFHCQIHLKSSSDIRVYEIECVVNAEQADAQLEFVLPAYQTVTQEIPITNISQKDWRFEAYLEGQWFYGPPVINVPVGETVPYPLTFKPVAERVTTGRLILRNVSAGTQNIFSLKGIGKKPLLHDYIVIECQVGTVVHKILWVHNYSKKVLTYKVYSNLSMLSGDPTLTVNPGDTGAYTLTISPCRRGIFRGIVSFDAQEEEPPRSQSSRSSLRADGKRALQKRRGVPPRTPEAANSGESCEKCKVWFALKICSTPAAAERTITVDCRALDTVGINIPITNPTDKELRIRVLLDHPSLSGEKSFTIGPKQTFSYHIQFSPAALGSFKGSVMFRSDMIGEFWYALKFNVAKPWPTGLPDVPCELGKWTYTHIALANPTNETLQLRMVNSDPRHFSVETDPEEPLTLPPHSTTDLPVRFRPSALGRRNHKATITFKCPKFEERIFHLTGSGRPPRLMDTISLSACIGKYASTIISFENPTLENVLVDVMLTDQELLSQCLSASDLSQSISKESAFQLLFNQPRGIQLAPKEKLDVPVLFIPDEMRTYKIAVVIHVMRENGENWPYNVTGRPNTVLNRNLTVAENGEAQGILWVYPIQGMSEAPQPKSVVIRCQARQRLEQKVEMMLIGVKPSETAPPDASNSATVNAGESSNTQEVTDGSPETLEFVYELQCQSDEIKSQLDSWLGMELIQKEWDTESRIVTLIFNVVFAPSKPVRNEAFLAVQCTRGGLWRFPLVLVATEPEVDDVINIEAVGLNKESVVVLKLTSQTSHPEPFTAHFLAGSDPDFLVMPQAGELLPAGTVGTPITVGYKPRMYGRKHTATLVVETKSMQWTYEINGLPPPSVPPTATAKVVCTSSYTGSSTVRQRNFLRENIQLTTTGVSSPIKGAPLVIREKQRKL